MKRAHNIFILMLIFCAIFLFLLSHSNSLISTSIFIPETEFHNKKWKEKFDSAEIWVNQQNFNQQYFFFIDMSLPSGSKRFIVYDLKKDSILKSGLVTHGRCNQLWLEGRKYSNVPGSGCTSLGKYRIGNKYSGKFGTAYKLHGLEKTNNKAYERYVVLHSHSCVPDEAIKDEICQSDGCPTVSPSFLKTLNPFIQNSSKPVLLWISE